MIAMIVSACEERQRQLAQGIAGAGVDRLIRASGLLSAVWYAKAWRPDLVIVDLWPLDACSDRLAVLLEACCPGVRLRFAFQSTQTALEGR